MAIFLDIGGHTIVAIMTNFLVFTTMARPIMAINSNILWSFLTLLQRLAKMQVSSENGIKKYAIYKKLWQKKRIRLKKFPFFLYLRWFWLKNGSSRGGTSNVSSELILNFLESGEQGEWD